MPLPSSPASPNRSGSQNNATRSPRPANGLPNASPPTRLAVSASGSALYALFGSDLWFSPDLGANWVHRWHFARGDLVALVLNPLNSRELLAGFYSPGLVLASNDAAISWHTLTS